MTTGKSMLVTSLIMALVAAVVFFIWKYGSGFPVLEGLFALYGFASLADDLCRWMCAPAGKMMRGGRQ